MNICILTLLFMCYVSLCCGVKYYNDSNFPLSTSGRWIVDKNGNRVKLACVNYYGAHMELFVVGGLQSNSLRNITTFIHDLGFNCIRLPYSISLVKDNPIVQPFAVAANPEFIGMHAMDIFDAVIEEMGRQHIMVILNLHVQKASWCCGPGDPNGLWSWPWDTEYDTQRFIETNAYMVQRYKNQSHVVGIDIKNELHDYGNQFLTWGTSNDNNTDWKVTSLLAANAIQAVNPDILVIIGGLCFNFVIAPMVENPPVLAIPNKMIIAAHTYGFCVWWQYVENGLNMIGLDWPSSRYVSGSIVIICCLIVIGIILNPAEREVILKATVNDYVTAISIWVFICISAMIGWTMGNRTGFYYACCAIEAYRYTVPRLGIYIPLVLVSIGVIIYTHKVHAHSLLQNNHQPQVVEMRKSKSKEDVKNPLEVGGDVGTDYVSAGESTGRGIRLKSIPVEMLHRGCVGRNPSCCVLTIIVGILALMGYASYLIWLANYTQTYAMHQSDLEYRWSLKKGDTFPYWLGEFGAADDTLWFQHMVQFLGETDLSYAYWAIDGARWNAYSNEFEPEGYGLLTFDYQHVLRPQIINRLRNISDFVYGRDQSPYYHTPGAPMPLLP